jgi:hypothetical protein
MAKQVATTDRPRAIRAIRERVLWEKVICRLGKGRLPAVV